MEDIEYELFEDKEEKEDAKQPPKPKSNDEYEEQNISDDDDDDDKQRPAAALESHELKALLRRQENEWKRALLWSRKKKIELIDRHYDAFRGSHILDQEHSSRMLTGEGDLRPNVLCLLLCPTKTELRDNDVYGYESNHSIKESCELELNDARSYYMYLIPYHVKAEDRDEGGGEEEMKKQQQTTPQKRVSEHHVWLPLAKRRVDTLNPDVVICFGVETFLVLSTGFSTTARRSNTKLVHDTVKFPQYYTIDKYNKARLFFCHHPYYMKQMIHNNPVQYQAMMDNWIAVFRASSLHIASRNELRTPSAPSIWKWAITLPKPKPPTPPPAKKQKKNTTAAAQKPVQGPLDKFFAARRD